MSQVTQFPQKALKYEKKDAWNFKFSCCRGRAEQFGFLGQPSG